MTLTKACRKRGISLYSISKRGGVSFRVLYMLAHNPQTNITIKTMSKIYKASGIKPEEYLDFDRGILT